MGYVDDRAYAEALVGRRLRQGRGRSLIGRELGHKGLPDEVVDAAVGAVDAEDELASATELAGKLVRRHAAEPEARRRDKVLAALARRGFPSGTARRALALAAEVEEA
jgi:regulatory protein